LDVPIGIRLTLLAGASYGILYLLASRAPYYPEKYPAGFWDMQHRLNATDVWLRTADGVRLHGWFVERPGASLVTLFLHGNAGNLTYRIADFENIPAAGSSLLMIDYRGYGRSSGWPTENGIYRDADAAYDYLLKRGYPPSKIVLHGESLGSAVAVDLAVRRPCAGLILEAPFTSAHELAGTVLPVVGPLLIWSFDTQPKIGRVRAPIYIVHGDRDWVRRYSQPRRSQKHFGAYLARATTTSSKRPARRNTRAACVSSTLPWAVHDACRIGRLWPMGPQHLTGFARAWGRGVGGRSGSGRPESLGGRWTASDGNRSL
jgi:hypothetical protein